jgi:uncharacterized protein with ATP-grasp and redox domains
MQHSHPNAPLPPEMTGVHPDSWAHDTVVRRWPETIFRVIQNNPFSSSVEARLRALAEGLPDAPISLISDPGAPDIDAWNRYVEPHIGKGWLEPPWFFCEHYLYRCIIADIGYHQPGPANGVDPFLFEKTKGLTAGLKSVRALADRLDASHRAGEEKGPVVQHLLYLDLWGNQADLSLWPTDSGAKPNHDSPESADEFLLVDDTAAAVAHLLRGDPKRSRVDILVDNAGFELLGDLILADHLLFQGIAATVRLHVKPHPTYVSDAVTHDVAISMNTLKSDEAPPVRRLGDRLSIHRNRDRLQIHDDYFWTSPLPGWKMPDLLRREFSESHLVVSKGDAHYRRLLGDRDWPPTTSFIDIVSYFPAPILALRTAKSELFCGLNPGETERVSAMEPAWQVNGRWGVAQFSGL